MCTDALHMCTCQGFPLHPVRPNHPSKPRAQLPYLLPLQAALPTAEMEESSQVTQNILVMHRTLTTERRDDYRLWNKGPGTAYISYVCLLSSWPDYFVHLSSALIRNGSTTLPTTWHSKFVSGILTDSPSRGWRTTSHQLIIIDLVWPHQQAYFSHRVPHKSPNSP